MSTPIYDSVVADQGWSPDELSPTFDLDYFLRDSVLKVQVHRRLVNAANKEREAAKVVPLTKVPVKRKGKRT